MHPYWCNRIISTTDGAILHVRPNGFLQTMDGIPEIRVMAAGMRACRRLNDYALAVRYLEAVAVHSSISLFHPSYFLYQFQSKPGFQFPERILCWSLVGLSQTKWISGGMRKFSIINNQPFFLRVLTYTTAEYGYVHRKLWKMHLSVYCIPG